MMSNQTKKEELVRKYVYSILVDLMIFLLLLLGFILLYDTISHSFVGFGIYLFWIFIFSVIVFHLISDTAFKFQSIGKKILKIIIQNKNGEKASILPLALQRIIELPILFVKNKESFLDKILNISNNTIAAEDTSSN